MKNKIISSMKDFTKRLTDSFKSNSLKQVLKIDFLSLILIIVLLGSFLLTVNYLTSTISQGMDGDELGASMLDASQDELNSLLFKVRALVLFFFILGPIILLILALIYGYSRHKVVEHLDHHKSKLSIKDFFKKKWIWSWLGLIILLTIIFSLIIFIFMVIKYALVLVYVFFLPQEQLLWEQIVYVFNFIFGVCILFLIFLIEHSLVKTHKAWKSISEGFSIFFDNFKKTTLAVLSSVIILTLFHFIIIYPVSRFLGNIWIIILQLIIAVLFLSWSRVYLLEILKEKKHKKE